MTREQQPLIILGSARRASDSRFYVDSVFRDMDTTQINLLDFQLAPYNYEGNYPPHDEMEKIATEILNHQTIIFATPVYWYAMSGLMKVLFDRFTDLVTVKKATGRKLKGKCIFFLAVGADPALPPGFEIPFKLTAAYLDMRFQGGIYFSTEHTNMTPQKDNEIKEFIENIEKAGKIQAI